MKYINQLAIRRILSVLILLVFAAASLADQGRKEAASEHISPGYRDRVLSFNKILAVELLTAGLGNGNVDVINSVIGDRYIQHNPAFPDGKEALVEIVEFLAQSGKLTHFTANFKRIVAQGKYVALHYHAPDFGVSAEAPEGSAVVDIFRIQRGKIVEHWDVIQAVETQTVSGNTMFDGAGNPHASVKHRDLTAHKHAVKRFYKALNAGDLGAFRTLISEDQYIQHNPGVANGVDALIDLFSLIGPVEANVKRIVAQGDLVFAHVHYVTFNQAGVDIFRFENGLIVEHWDVLQAIPDQAENDNGMF